MNNYEIGMIGEEAVALYLEKVGCNILCRNFRTTNGEIDVIFEEGGDIVFGEVKTRTNNNYGYPCEAVDRKKRRKIIYVAKQYVSMNEINDMTIRFDIFEVYYNERKIRHIRDAYFEEI